MAKIILDDGKECVLSKEDEQRFRQILSQPNLYEKTIGNVIRVSVIGEHFRKSCYPIRLSVMYNCKQGEPEGSFSNKLGNETGGLPGYTMTLADAEDLIGALKECIEFVEKNETEKF